MAEKRLNWRWDVALPCLFRGVSLSGASIEGEGCLVDISFGGACVRSDIVPEAGTQVRMQVLLSEGQRQIDLEGSVVRAERPTDDVWKNGFAITFSGARAEENYRRLTRVFLNEIHQSVQERAKGIFPNRGLHIVS